jgi:hypothetical protein
MFRKLIDNLTRPYSDLLWNRTNCSRSNSRQTGCLCKYVHHTCSRSGRCSILVTRRARVLIPFYSKTKCWKHEVYYSLLLRTDKTQSWIGNPSSNAQNYYRNTNTGCSSPRMSFLDMFVHRRRYRSGRSLKLVLLEHFLCRCQKLAGSS